MHADRPMTDRCKLPLVVDLDSTLLRTDLLAELLPGHLLRNPLRLPRVLGWMAAGRARLKDELATRSKVDPATLPYNEELLAWLRSEHAAGRRIWLASASNHTLVEPIAEYLGLFEGVFASDAQRNLKGDAKRAALVERFGRGGYDYAGDSVADLAVWRDAHAAIVIGSPTLAARAAQLTTVERVIQPGRTDAASWLKGFRLQHWIKNLLVLVPLLTAHRWDEPASVLAALTAFLGFSFVASTVYALNDLADVADDRAHPVKRGRPLAAGRMKVRDALAGSAVLTAGALLCMLLLPSAYAGWLVTYLVTSIVYSAWLKRRPIVDVMTLAGLYCVRLLAGAAAIGVDASFWLLAVSMFLFLSLALSKRFAELRRHALVGGRKISRNYHVDDQPVILTGGISAGMASVLVFALYIQSDQILLHYSHPQRLWLACPILLYWVLRNWFHANRGEVDEDPLAWAARDPVSWVAVIVTVATFAVAL